MGRYSGQRYNSLNKFFLIILIFLLIEGQSLGAQSEVNFTTEWEQDTITVAQGDSVLILTHRFVLRNTETIITEGTLIIDYQLQSLLGAIILKFPTKISTEYIVHYEYLKTPFPTKFGPPLAYLPKLENMDEKENKHELENSEFEAFFDESFPMVADGTIFRGITFSPLGDLSLTGGLRLSLQGQLSEDLIVSGTLTDQNSPIQPEGNTQTLDEIDKVYLEVKHPSAKIVAGDIDMNLKYGQFLNMSRRLEGLHVELFNNRTNASGYIGSTKGKFHKTDFMGEDQNQGPYPLSSEIGSRNIIVMAGSERIWIDGVRMERGENNDYTIDYSSAEIIFTPNRVIDSNSRIYVEFEYSDLIYPRSIASAAITRKFSDERLITSISWVQEKDNIQSQLTFGISDDESELLKSAGDDQENMRFLSAEEDSSGNYIRTDSIGEVIFAYVPDDEKTEGVTYYWVNFFKIGPSGEYSRNVTANGELYYEFVIPNERDGRADLYVPWKTIKFPQSHQIMNLATEANIFDSTKVSFQLTGSLLDRNLYSKIDDKDNQTFAGIIDLRHNQKLPFELGSVSLHAMTRRIGKKFTTFQRDRQVEFSREWNLLDNESADNSEQRITKFEVNHKLRKNISSTISLGTYRDGIQNATRLEGRTAFSSHWIPSMVVDATTSTRKLKQSGMGILFIRGSVKNDPTESEWLRRRFSITLFPGDIHLFAHYLGEERSSDFRINESGGGIRFDGNRLNTKLGLTRRLDFLSGNETNEWDKTSNSWLGEIEFAGRWRSGFKMKTILKKRVKSYFNGEEDIDYYLARGSVGYTPRAGSIRTNFDFKLEETLFEKKIVVYDSVGSGLGSYRYDPNYDQYFSDVNGDYIAIFLPSGNKVPTSRLSTGLKAFFNFRNTDIPFIRFSTWKIYGATDFNGSNLNGLNVFMPEFLTEGINRSRVSLRNEVTYSPKPVNRRIRFSTNNRREVSRQTVGASLQKNASEYEVEVENPLSNDIIFITSVTTKLHEVKSTVALRERTISGWLLSPGIRWQLSKELEIGGDLFVGKDKGSHMLDPFTVNINGIGVHALWFVRRGGRIESSMEYFDVGTDRNISISLPPEAADGLQIGNTMRLSVSGIITLANNISLTANLSYLNDPLHENFINFSGEVRATF